MIPTIISRCQRFDFRKLTLSEIVKRLEWISKKEGIKVEKSALEFIALSAGGSIRDAEGLLDQALTFASNKIVKIQDLQDLLGMVDTLVISQLVDFISEKKTTEAIEFLNKTLEKGYDPLELNKALIKYLRQALLLRISPEFTNPVITGLTKEEQEKLHNQVKSFEERDLSRILNLFLEAENKMKYSPIPQLPLELAIIEALQKEEK
tara:strand:- start:143 stop:763 length:621 start_codon:yes stop_codon:yes gene_type:complete